MSKANKTKVFKTFEEYSKFYAARPSKQEDNTKSKYYRAGENVAKMACEKTINQFLKDQTNQNR